MKKFRKWIKTNDFLIPFLLSWVLLDVTTATMTFCEAVIRTLSILCALGLYRAWQDTIKSIKER